MVTFIFPPTNICIQLIWYSKILCSTIFSSFTFLIRIRMYRLYLTDYKHSFHKSQRFVFIVYHNIKNINYSFYYEPKTINCISMPYLFQFSDGFLALRDAMHETGGGRAIKILLSFPHKITDSNHSWHFAVFILVLSNKNNIYNRPKIFTIKFFFVQMFLDFNTQPRESDSLHLNLFRLDGHVDGPNWRSLGLSTFMIYKFNQNTD